MARTGYAKGANSGHVTTQRATPVRKDATKGVREIIIVHGWSRGVAPCSLFARSTCLFLTLFRLVTSFRFSNNNYNNNNRN